MMITHQLIVFDEFGIIAKLIFMLSNQLSFENSLAIKFFDNVRVTYKKQNTPALVRIDEKSNAGLTKNNCTKKNRKMRNNIV